MQIPPIKKTMPPSPKDSVNTCFVCCKRVLLLIFSLSLSHTHTHTHTHAHSNAKGGLLCFLSVSLFLPFPPSLFCPLTSSLDYVKQKSSRNHGFHQACSFSLSLSLSLSLTFSSHLFSTPSTLNSVQTFYS